MCSLFHSIVQVIVVRKEANDAIEVINLKFLQKASKYIHQNLFFHSKYMERYKIHMVGKVLVKESIMKKQIVDNETHSQKLLT